MTWTKCECEMTTLWILLSYLVLIQNGGRSLKYFFCIVPHFVIMQTKEFAPPYLPPYEHAPAWIPPHERDHHPDYCSDLERFLPRNISLQRSKTSEQLGFNIRGGREHNCGIYISKVMPNSEADRLGLQEGDQIMSVNEQNFETIDHSEAVKILKMNTSIWMVVRYFPYGYNQTYFKGHSTPTPDSPRVFR